ncbi:MAG TPA: NAD(P)H-binding protein [Edaphobacter sp.]|nr:NAD(P)H-binding protein [Edaphobacter sp.]
MNVVVYGATGNSGSQIVKELLSRGHKVTGVARKIDSLKTVQGLTAKTDDLLNVDAIAAIIKGADAVVSAYQPPPDNTDALVDVTKRQIEAVKKAGVPRLLVVGGAGLLEVAPGVTLINSGHLPEAYMPIAVSHEKALHVLQASDINWTYLSPAAFFVSGERTGKFRLGTKELISDAKGESKISFEDYAIALVDEIEKPAHERAFFSIGY